MVLNIMLYNLSSSFGHKINKSQVDDHVELINAKVNHLMIYRPLGPITITHNESLESVRQIHFVHIRSLIPVLLNLLENHQIKFTFDTIWRPGFLRVWELLEPMKTWYHEWNDDLSRINMTECSIRSGHVEFLKWLVTLPSDELWFLQPSTKTNNNILCSRMWLTLLTCGKPECFGVFEKFDKPELTPSMIQSVMPAYMRDWSLFERALTLHNYEFVCQIRKHVEPTGTHTWNRWMQYLTEKEYRQYRQDDTALTTSYVLKIFNFLGKDEALVHHNLSKPSVDEIYQVSDLEFDQCITVEKFRSGCLSALNHSPS
jgi:hypothetical protein